MFKIAGTFQGRQAEVVWDDGRLRGDPGVMRAARKLVADKEQILITPTGPSIIASLDTPEDAGVTLGDLFEPFYSLSGDEPLPRYPIEPLPPGAVG